MKKPLYQNVYNVINSDTLGIPKEIIISDNNSTDGTKKFYKILNTIM